jgi:hypothetical protein
VEVEDDAVDEGDGVGSSVVEIVVGAGLVVVDVSVAEEEDDGDEDDAGPDGGRLVV